MGNQRSRLKVRWLIRFVYPVALLALASLVPGRARADFFDDARRTFQTDIPHFFQDDIPCAFGGKPTSGTKASCKSPEHPAKPAPDKSGHSPTPKDKPNGPGPSPTTGQ